MNRPGRGFCLVWAMLSIHAGVVLGATWVDVSSGLPAGTPGVRAMVIDRASGSTLYAQTLGGGLFKSLDGGVNWKAVSKIAGVQTIAVDPTSPSTVYAGTARGVFKSTNGGEGWTSAGLAGNSVGILAIDPVTPTTLYAYGIGGNIYKSTDGGASWTAHALGLPISPTYTYAVVSAILLDPLTPSTLYAMVSFGPGSGLYKSSDAGESWALVNSSSFARLVAIDPVTTSILYGIQAGNLSKSTDGGTTWTPTGFTKDALAFAIDPKNPNTMYASTYAHAGPGTFPSGQAIYKSVDGGNTWDTVDTSLPPAGSLIFSPLDSSTVYATTFNGGVFKTTDAGATWNATNTGLRVFDIRVLVPDPVDPATVYTGGDFGLFKTVDAGGQWNQEAVFQLTCCTFPPGTLPPGVPPPSPPFPPFPPVAPATVDSLLIDFTNPSTQYVGTSRTDGCFYVDVLILKTTDAGVNWTDAINPQQDNGCLASGLMGMGPTDPSTLYLRWGDDMDGFAMRKSTDGGATWSFTTLSGGILSALVIDPSNSKTLYAATDNGVVQSTDGGATWNTTGLTNTNVNLLAIDPHQPNVLYAATTRVYPDSPGLRSLFKSTDSGATWSPINEGLSDLLDARAPVNALVVDPDHSNVLYLATSAYGVFRSSDAGATWSPFNDGLSHFDVQRLTTARGEFSTIYAGTPGGVFKIVDDGR